MRMTIIIEINEPTEWEHPLLEIADAIHEALVDNFGIERAVIKEDEE